MNDISKRPGSPLDLSPADYAKRLATGIQESRSSTIIAGGGKPLLRLLKSGKWVFGAGDEEVQIGSQWVVNVMSLGHGWSCWVESDNKSQKNELKGELILPMIEPKPPRPAPIEDTPFSEVRAFELKCLDGDDVGEEILYKNGSVGGMRAVDGLLAAIFRQLAEDPEHPCPVITLDVSSYNHNKWGLIFTPVFTITGWADMLGNLAGSGPHLVTNDGAAVDPDDGTDDGSQAAQPAAPVAQTAPAAAPAKPRKAPLTVAAKPADPAPTAATHVGQRRRPGR